MMCPSQTRLSKFYLGLFGHFVKISVKLTSGQWEFKNWKKFCFVEVMWRDTEEVKGASSAN